MHPEFSPQGGKPGHTSAIDRLVFIGAHLGQYDRAEVEFRQDALNQDPHAVITIERNGKGYLLTLQSEGSIGDGAVFSVSRLGKIIDRFAGRPLSAAAIDQYLAPDAPYVAWLSKATNEQRAAAENRAPSDFPFNLFAADGITVTPSNPQGSAYMIIAEREVADGPNALNFSINQVDRNGDLLEVRRAFISREITENAERQHVREELSQVVSMLSQPETFNQAIANLDRLIDAGYVIGTIDPTLSIREDLDPGKIVIDVDRNGELEVSFTPARSVNVQYMDAQPVDEITFLTERTELFK